MMLNAQYHMQVSSGFVSCVGIGNMRDSSLYGTQVWDRNNQLFISYIDSPVDTYAIWAITLAGEDANYVVSTIEATSSKSVAIEAAWEIIETRGYKAAVKEGTSYYIWEKSEFKNFLPKMKQPIGWGIDSVHIEYSGKRFRLLP